MPHNAHISFCVPANLRAKCHGFAQACSSNLPRLRQEPQIQTSDDCTQLPEAKAKKAAHILQTLCMKLKFQSSKN